jgi:cytochrome c oxidase subunit 2
VTGSSTRLARSGWLFALAIGVTAAACDSGDAAPAGSQPGRQIAISAGCGSCHGSDFQGGIGPTWVGLAGSEVELDDGSTVVADREYLIEAITDPSARKVAGYSLAMPGNRLDQARVDAIVDYIESLSDDPNG